MSANGGATGMGTASEEVQEFTIKELEKDAFDDGRTPSDPSVRAEKGETINVTNREDDDEDDSLILTHEEQFPIDPNVEDEPQQFTVRAVFVGCCLGGVIAASK